MRGARFRSSVILAAVSGGCGGGGSGGSSSSHDTETNTENETQNDSESESSASRWYIDESSIKLTDSIDDPNYVYEFDSLVAPNFSGVFEEDSGFNLDIKRNEGMDSYEIILSGNDSIVFESGTINSSIILLFNTYEDGEFVNDLPFVPFCGGGGFEKQSDGKTWKAEPPYFSDDYDNVLRNSKYYNFTVDEVTFTEVDNNTMTYQIKSTSGYGYSSKLILNLSLKRVTK